MKLTIESNDNPIFIEPVTGYRMKIELKRLRWDLDEQVFQPKWVYVPEVLLYEGTVNEEVRAAHHRQITIPKEGTILVEVKIFYYEDGGQDIDGTPFEGYGNYVNSAAINQGRVVTFRVTDNVWVNAETGSIVSMNQIPLTDGEGNLIEEPHAGLMGEYDRFILLKNSGASVDQLIIGSCIQALENGRFV